MGVDLTSPQAFASLVREHGQAVFRTLTRLTGAGPHVQDLAQEVFLRLYRALPEFRGDAALSTYLYRITVNVAQDEWKRRRREREHVAPPGTHYDTGDAAPLENMAADAFAGEHARTPEQQLQLREFSEQVEVALLALPERERTVLVLYHQEELSYEGVAAALGLPVNTVRTHLHRGRARLRELLAAGARRGRREEAYAGKAGKGCPPVTTNPWSGCPRRSSASRTRRCCGSGTRTTTRRGTAHTTSSTGTIPT